MDNKSLKKSWIKSFSSLLMLVLFVFFIMLVSIAIAGILVQFMVRLGILPSLFERSYITGSIYVLLVSLLIGTILAIIGGKRFLKPLHTLINATKEIASGNFNIRVDIGRSRELTLLAESFNEMAKELSSVEALRTDFVSNISHEFKTPIVSIKGFAKRLKKDTLTDEQRKEYLDIIISESERLALLSSNVLLLSKLESTENDKEKNAYYLDEQLRRVILSLEPQLQKKQLEVEIELETVQIVANEEMLHYLWLNLLGNSIKFSFDGGVIGVTLKQIGDNAVISISDTGIGMDDEVKKHIFDKFYQADRSRATEGNGLGMSLVKRILKLENGEIAVDSEPNKGTAFTVLLPQTERGN